MAVKRSFSLALLLLSALSAVSGATVTKTAAGEKTVTVTTTVTTSAVPTNTQARHAASKHHTRTSRTERASRVTKKSPVSRHAVHAAVLRSAVLTSVRRFSPIFATKFFQTSRTERFIVNLLLQPSGRYSIFLPTDHAYAKYLNARSRAGCKKLPLDDLLAGMIVPEYLTNRAMKRLKHGSKLPTMSAISLTVRATSPLVQLEVLTGAKKVVSFANVVKADKGNSRTFVIHYVDNIITPC